MELTVDQALHQGISAHKEGKLQEAERLYRAILQAQPKHPDANHNLGVLAVSVDKPLDALPLFKRALEANPQIEQFWLSYLDALIAVGCLDDATRVLAEGEKFGVFANKLDAIKQRLKQGEPTDMPKTPKGQPTSRTRKKPAEKKMHEKRQAQIGSSVAEPSQDQLNSLLEHYTARKLEEAEALATSLTKQFPEHPFGWKVLGVIFEQTGRLRE